MLFVKRSFINILLRFTCTSICKKNILFLKGSVGQPEKKKKALPISQVLLGPATVVEVVSAGQSNLHGGQGGGEGHQGTDQPGDQLEEEGWGGRRLDEGGLGSGEIRILSTTKTKSFV